MQDGIVQFARQPQRPEPRALRMHGLGGSRRRLARPLDSDGGAPRAAVDLNLHARIGHRIRLELALQWRQRDALGVAAGTIRLGGELLRRLLDRSIELRVRHRLVHKAPFDGAGALHALLDGAERIGQVAAHLALVGDARKPAGAGQDGEQGQLGQRHRGVAVVGEQDVVGGERQLVAAAGGGASDGTQVLLAGAGAGILDGVARLVGELAEVDLVGVGGARQHADVGAGAEHPVLAGPQHHRLHLRVLEAQPLHRVGELDIDAQVVGVELELIALEQRRRSHRHP